MAVTRLGIDFGPTTARAAWVQDETGVLLSSLVGQKAFPAVVGLDRTGALHVGETARRQLLLHPDRTAHRLRRFLGTSMRLDLDKKRFSARELCAVVLSQLRDFAEERLATPIQAATLAVPCQFAPEQHQDLIAAARMAGFKTAQTVLEPLAIARAYSLFPADVPDGKAVLVCDLGATHLEATVLTPKDDRWSVLATAQRETGSELVDERIAEYLGQNLLRQYGLAGFSHQKTHMRLRLAAEWAKCRLSDQETVTVHLPAVQIADTTMDLETELGRDQLALLVEDDLRRAFEVIEIALRQARVSKPDLFAVLLSGGPARLPLCAELLTSQTLVRPTPIPAPEEAIAIGAALLGNAATK
jgi:molecular chaperone DnaK